MYQAKTQVWPNSCTLQANQEPLPNPYGDQLLMEIQPSVADVLITRTSYVKKLLEDCNNSEDTTKLLRVGSRTKGQMSEGFG